MTGTKWLPNLQNNPGSKYIVLVQSLRAAIRSGELPKGTQMLPVRELAWQLGITPGTVARAYKMATEEGLLEAVVGRGTFVADSVAPESLPPSGLLYPPTDPGVIDLRGACVGDFGQNQMIQDVMSENTNASNYLLYPRPENEMSLCQHISDWLGQVVAGTHQAQDIFLGLGAQNTVMTILQATLRGNNPVVLSEDLGYPGFRYAAQIMRAEIIGIETDSDGMRPDRLEAALKQNGGQVLITSPHLHNPTNVSVPMQRRKEIAEIARRYQLQIIEDACFSLCPRDTPPGYRAICPERSWYVGSLSKIFSPALRLGFGVCAQGSSDQARRVVQSSHYGYPSPLTDISARLFEHGHIERVSAQVVEEIRKRTKIAVNILGQWDIMWHPDSMFVWLKLPRGWRTSRFMMACDNAGIRVKPADDFTLPDSNSVQAVRISINAQVPVEQFEKALYRLSGLLASPPVLVDV